MMTQLQVEQLEKLIEQLASLHNELSVLAKKSPNDAVNAFKLKYINIVVDGCNVLLGEKYKPFVDFEVFDADDVPSNSDVTFILSQYIASVEIFRSDNIVFRNSFWHYMVEDESVSIRTKGPARLK
ncbi:hypothetical protein [Desulfovibrio sp. DV]|uniref:hypothetical protein n=1 Tax=Desulfovibrio sp. DV TaxID=1844708 RepID=UPI00094BBF67|nr:hypothetical protein [Desulfovibrio sp. DV]